MARLQELNVLRCFVDSHGRAHSATHRWTGSWVSQGGIGTANNNVHDVIAFCCILERATPHAQAL